MSKPSTVYSANIGRPWQSSVKLDNRRKNNVKNKKGKK